MQWRIATLDTGCACHPGLSVGTGVHGRRQLGLFIVT